MLLLALALFPSSLPAPLPCPRPQASEASAPRPSPVATLRDEAERVLALVESPGAKAFLAATAALPEIGERVVLYDQKTRQAVSAEAHAKLGEEEQARYQPSSFGGEFYYSTRYGSPLAYARLLDVLGGLIGPNTDVLSGKRVLDFGYGGIGHLRLLASLGCDAVGVDVDPLLDVYYGPEDRGTIPPATEGGRPGRLRLVCGSWPGDARVHAEVGGEYDLILSKNVLKKGYVRPAQKVDPRMLVDLGVPPERFLEEVAAALRPGGVFALYNLCPAPRADRYVPWAYGESPFTREEFEAAGFELLAFDVDDRDQAKELGYALRWDQQGQDVEEDLFAWYTVARRRKS